MEHHGAVLTLGLQEKNIKQQVTKLKQKLWLTNHFSIISKIAKATYLLTCQATPKEVVSPWSSSAQFQCYPKALVAAKENVGYGALKWAPTPK
jgi:hypothetical protein